MAVAPVGTKSAIDNPGGRILGFDGLRAVAVLLVLVMHKTEFGAASRLGFFGVWLFFLLSGYLIIGQLHEARIVVERHRTSYRRALLTFWYRRAFRILPAYYFLLSALAVYYLGSGRQLHGFGFHLVYLSNLYFMFDMAQFKTTFAHLWSLAVEEQFYLLSAPIILLIGAARHRRLCVTVLLASLSYRLVMVATGADAFRVYIDSLVNFGLLALGGLIYLSRGTAVPACARLCRHREWLAFVVMAAFLLLSVGVTSVASPDSALAQMLYLLGVACGGALIMIVISNQQSAMVALLECAPLALLGKLSYGVYLYNDYVPADLPQRLHGYIAAHAPAFLYFVRWLPSGDGASSMITRAAEATLSAAITFGLAYCSWVLLEAPMLRLRDRRRSRRTGAGLESNVAARPCGAVESLGPLQRVD